MKKHQLGQRMLACVLALSMILSMSTTAFAAAPSGEIKYVSLGDSMANGYGLDGYQPSPGVNVDGYLQESSDAYPAKVAAEKGWDLTQLAISAMRAEDLNFILNFDWNDAAQVELVTDSQSWSKDDFVANKNTWDETFGCGDLYTWDEFVANRFKEYSAIDPEQSGTTEYAKMFQNSIKDADYVSMGIGNANFGVFLLGRITNAFGVLGGNPAGDAWIDFQDALSKLDEPAKEAVMQVYNKLTSYLPQQNYIAAEQAELLVNTIAYAVASYVLNYAEVIDRIVELNPDVNIILVGLMNTMSGSKMSFWGQEIDLGDMLDIVINTMNTYVAALPSAMKLAGNYPDATFYYAEEPHVEMVVNTLYAAWGDSWTGNGYDVIRERLVKDICGGMVFDMVAPLFQSIVLDESLSPTEITEYEESGESAFSSLYPNTGAIANKVASCQVYLAFEEAIVESTQMEVMDAEAIFSLADSVKLNAVFEEIGAQINPSDFQETLTTALTNNSTMMSLLNLFARHIIGNGIGSHPSAAGHDALTAAILDTLENEYTTDDKTLESLKEAYEDVKDLIIEYYDEAYAKAYEELDNKGYIDTAANGIDVAIEAISNIDISGLEMTDEFRAELTEELAAVVVTLTEIKSVLESDTAKDVDGLLAAVAELKDDLWLHLANAGAILDQAGYDAACDVRKKLDGILGELSGIVSLDELKAKLDAYIDSIKENAALEFAKLGHRHYEADEDSYYLAIGGDTLNGTGLNVDDLIAGTTKKYNDLVKSKLGISNGSVVKKTELLATEVVDLITSNASNITEADFITYQLDASAFVNTLFADIDIDWSKYIDPEISELFNVILEEATEILTADWAIYANEEIDEVLATVIPQIQPVVAEYVAKAEDAVAEYITINVDEAKIDSLIAQGISCVREVITFVADKKDVAYADAVATIEGIDDTIINYAEKLAYACVAYAMDTVKAVETIQAINPDATLLVVGMYNPLVGLEIAVNGETIDAGEMFENAISLTNAFYYTYAAANGKFAFVNVSDTEINGFDTAIEVSDIDALITVLPNLLRNIDNNMHASSEGHAYIADQIKNAVTCDYVYEQQDADNHKAKCSICGYEKTEAHDFGGTTTCTKCGYEQEVSEEPDPTPTPTPTPDPEPTPTPGSKPSSKPSSGSSGGGGSISTKFTVQFETNGGSAIEKAEVKKGEVLVAPKNPTKAGFAFAGWYTDKALTVKYDFNTPVTKSFTLYAKWVKEDIFSKFTDINKDAWYYDYVKAIVEKGLMNGISETEFAPEKTLTRGMFVTILHRVEGEPKSEKGANFKDVAAGQYYENAVKWASENGIVNGISETEFAPDAEVTRQQMAAMLARYAAYKKIEVPAEGDVTYTDSDQIAEYAKDAVNIAKKLGILIGNEDGSFAPERNATRAEAATLFVRLLDAFEKVK